MARVGRISVHRTERLDVGWELAAVAPGPGAALDPEALDASSGAGRVEWLAAPVPGTVASALRAAKVWNVAGPRRDFDASDWWYRCRFDAAPAEAGEEVVLRFGGLATVADVWLNGARLFRSENMFHAHTADVTALLRGGGNELHLRFHSLHALLQARRPRPRWRTRLVEHPQLRWWRTTLLGRIPGWTPPVAAVGPWRAVSLERRRLVAVDEASVRARVLGDGGVVTARLRLRALGGVAIETAALRVARVRVARGERGEPAHAAATDARADDEAFAPLVLGGMGADGGHDLEGELRLPAIDAWWPHTHGAQPLYSATVLVRAGGKDVAIDLGMIAFRTVEVVTDDGGFALRVNGVDVFCRGACWTTTDIVDLGAGAAGAAGAASAAGEGEDRSAAAYAEAIELARAGGMNMLRVGGTMVYEDDAFYEACDRAGVLVWQDCMFANMDYPADDAAFLASVTREVKELLGRTETRACLAVLCGNSEIEQQTAMLGVPRELWKGPLFEHAIPALARALRPDLAYCASSPTGGTLPFQVSAGVSHYYGVGAYLRPLEDARRAEVRFTSECLGFSNVPSDKTIDLVLGDGESAFHHPAWKARVPRDSGPGWDFEDVRDHYTRLLFGVDPARVRYADVERYLALGRVTTGEVMAATFAEWRRRRSTCRGGLVWFYRDLWPGAGWGVVDSTGAPKAAYYYLRRAFQPVALLVCDEGLDGLALHAVNDSGEALDAEVRLSLYRNGEVRVAEGRARVLVPARSVFEVQGDALFDRFLDTTHAYRFGPPGHDVAVAEWIEPGSGVRLGQAFHFPGGQLPAGREADLGLEAVAEPIDARAFRLTLRSRRLALSVAIDAKDLRPDDAFFHVEPGGVTETILRATGRGAAAAKVTGSVLALNAQSPAKIVMGASPSPALGGSR